MDFFKSPAVKLLRRMSGGDTYALIYLEMILLSLENNGFIYFTGIGKDMADEISLVLDEKKIDVEFLLSFLTNKKLIEFSDPNVFKFSEDVTEGLIGKEQSSAKRVRAWRKRQKALQSNNDVTTSNTELEKELDIEKDIEKDQPTTEPKKEKQVGGQVDESIFQKVINFYEKNIGFIAPVYREDFHYEFEDWIKLNTDQKEVANILCMAIKEAIGYRATNKPKYIMGILKRWRETNTTTLKAIEGSQKEFERKKEQKMKYGREPTQKERLPNWAEEGYVPEKQKSTMSDEEREALKQKLARFKKKED